MTAILYPLSTHLSVTMAKGEVLFEHRAANLLCSHVTKCATLGEGGRGREGRGGEGRGGESRKNGEEVPKRGGRGRRGEGQSW